jgi:uncharacterized protein YunC (DUF1805 family)
VDGKVGIVAVNLTGTATFDHTNVGNVTTVTHTSPSLAGADARNYNLTTVVTTTADITKKDTTGSFTASNKTYDGTTDATVNVATVDGKVGTDAVNLTGTATFDDKHAGNGKTVTLNSPSLAGDDAGNYNLTTVDTTTADITKKDTTGSFTAANKAYDGTNAATVATATVTGRLCSEDAVPTGTATFDDKNVGIGKTVTLNSPSLTGGNAGNYNLTTVDTATANITKKDTTGSFTASNKTYNGTTDATVNVATVDGKVGIVAVNLTGTATFDDKNVGNGKTVTLNSPSLAGS